MSQPTQAPQRREIELDFLRGIAILMVLEYHMPLRWVSGALAGMGWEPFTWAGVDVFFVLSGFLVGGLLVKEWVLTRRVDARRFLVRRGFKIWPQYYIFLALNLVSGHRTFAELLPNLLNVQNYFSYSISHTWTLAVEEHAYLLLLLLLFAAARLGARIRTVFLVTLGLAAAVVVWRFTLAFHGVVFLKRTDARLDGILYGLLLAILYHAAPARFAWLQRWRAVWLALVPVCAVGIASPLLERGLGLAPLVAFAVRVVLADLGGMALFLSMYRRSAVERPWIYRLVAWIGLYSYGIYLWHIGAGGLAHSLSHHVPARVRGVADGILGFGLSLAVGIVATRAIEFPVLKVRDRLFPRRVDSAAGTPAEVEAASGHVSPPESVST